MEKKFILTFCLLFLSILTLFLYHERNDFVTYFTGAITGGMVEIICVYFGIWKYSNPTFFIPFWLPLLWGLAALVIRRFSLFIENKNKFV
ncbi:MAG: DUF2878 family protein [Candidatus Aenigmatarchaeota archaeon]